VLDTSSNMYTNMDHSKVLWFFYNMSVKVYTWMHWKNCVFICRITRIIWYIRTTVVLHRILIRILVILYNHIIFMLLFRTLVIIQCYDIRILWTDFAHLLRNFWYPQYLSSKYLNLFDNSSVFYKCLFFVRLPEDDLKEIETCRGINGMYVKVYIFLYLCIGWCCLLNVLWLFAVFKGKLY